MLAPAAFNADNPGVRLRGGRGWAGRLTATTSALALAGAALVMLAQGTAATQLQAAADGTGTTSTAPTSGHIDIETGAGGIFHFVPNNLTIAKGGTLTISNNTPYPHTFTSRAFGPSGVSPLFNVTIDGFATDKSIPISALGGGTYDFYCRFHPNMTGALVIDGPPDGQITNHPKFQQPLVQPPRLTGSHIRIVMRKADVRILPHGPKTPMWTYGGTFPGPTIVRPTGHATQVTYVNDLPKRVGSVTVHLHGGHQASRYDGQPDSYLIGHGRSRTSDSPLPDGGKPLPAALRFYHDHRMNYTARNNWFGLTGMFLTTDPHDAKIGLPHGRYDVPLMVTDRSFRSDNRLRNPFAAAAHARAGSGSSAAAGSGMAGMAGMAGMTGAGSTGLPGTIGAATVGDLSLVNGRFAPYLHVQAGMYRFQILNASLFATYNFALSDGQFFTQVGSDDGLLPHPVQRQSILLGPAQRADVVVDFKPDAGKSLMLTSIARNDGSVRGIGSLERALMQFRVGTTPAPATHVPATLTTIPRLHVPKKVAMRWVFGKTWSKTGAFWSINGRRYNPDRVDHKVLLGSTERWVLHNSSDITHYVHLHEELWHTLSRDGKPPPPWERGYEDTWRLDPGETVVVAARFTDFTGRFMVHCHMLDHEDDGMMATFEVVRHR